MILSLGQEKKMLNYNETKQKMKTIIHRSMQTSRHSI